MVVVMTTTNNMADFDWERAAWGLGPCHFNSLSKYRRWSCQGSQKIQGTKAYHQQVYETHDLVFTCHIRPVDVELYKSRQLRGTRVKQLAGAIPNLQAG